MSECRVALVWTFSRTTDSAGVAAACPMSTNPFTHKAKHSVCQCFWQQRSKRMWHTTSCTVHPPQHHLIQCCGLFNLTKEAPTPIDTVASKYASMHVVLLLVCSLVCVLLCCLFSVCWCCVVLCLLFVCLLIGTQHVFGWMLMTQVNLVTESFHQREAEFLFAPYSVFTVGGVEWRTRPSSTRPHVVYLNAATDNRDEAEDLPLAPWI